MAGITQHPADRQKQPSFDSSKHLEIGCDGAAADVDEFSHVIVGVKGPDAAFQVQVLVKLDAFGLTDVGIELVRAIVTRSQRDAVIGHIIQEACL